MAILTKTQLSASNASSFPDNTSGAITPTILRDFNTSIIDTLVDSLDTGSFATTSSFNAYTSSNDTKWSTLGGLTGSYVTSAITGSSLVTASFSGNTLTFTKGNGTQFGVVIPDVSGSTIPAGTISGSSQITALGFVSSSVTGSSLITGSVSGNVLTFTKGDGNGFSLTVATGSAINTGSFATTGSNTFTGNQTITGSVKNGIFFKTGSSEFFVGQDLSDNLIVSSSSQSKYVEFVKSSGWIEFNASQVNFNGQTTLRSNTECRKITQEVGYPVIINGTLSASLASGYAFVGGADGYSKQVPTASFSSASLVTGSVNVNVLTFTKGDGSTFDLTVAASGSVVPGTISGSAQITAFGFVSSSSGDTGSLMTTGSVSGNVLTFTKGDATTFTLTVATGSGGGSTFSNPSVESISGSLLLTANTFTSGAASVTHLSASAQNQANLVFKNNNTTATTIISGSSNIYTNPATPTTGYTRYIGGSNNLYLNSTNGINSQITQSAASVSGNRAAMNNNIFNGTGNFVINQAPNTGTHTYSQNIIGGTSTTTINALGFTGSLNFNSNFNNNGTITINAASASVAQIATGISGSGTVDVNQNILATGTLTISTPRVAGFAGQTHNSNILAGTSIAITNISSSAAVNASANITNGNITYTNAAASAIHTSNGVISSCQGAITVNAIGSAVAIANGIFIGTPTITNNSFSGSAGGGQLNANRNLIQGQGHTISVTGSTETATGVTANFSDNTILGKNNTIFSNQTGAGSYRDLNGIVIGGQNLIVSASNSFTLTEGGGAHFGRYNVNDGIRNKTGEMVFSVGTGTSTTRKTGFLIDSGSNTFVEGTLNVSGSSQFTGSVTITGSVTVNGSSILTSNVTGSFATTGSNSFNGNQRINGNTTITGSFIQSGSVSIQGETTFVNKNGNNTSVILGQFAMSDITGSVEKSVAIGQGAMRYASGSSLDSIAIGFNTLPVTTGVNNFALGSQALAENTSGGQNTAIGTGALNKNTIGIKNTAIGDGSGFSNVSGSNNTYIGPSAGNNIFGGNNLLLGGYQGVGEVVNNNIILSTGGGSIKAQYNETAWLMEAPVNFTTGSNQQAGTAVLDGGNPGTVTVSNSLVTANSIIMLTKQTLTNSHMVAVSSKGAGTFTITSNGNGDGDTVGWFIINNS